MPTYTSNSEQLLADLKSLATRFGFLATIEGKTLGDDIAAITADSIHARSVDRESGTDGQWPANAPKYAAWKARKYGVDRPNIRTGQMLSLQSLLGQTAVTTHQVQMMYGTGHPATRSATGMGFDPGRDDLADVDKAYFCSTSRPFYELDDEISDRVFDRIEKCLEDYLKNW